MSRKYKATGPEVEFEPGSRGRVLRNRLGITRVRDMSEAESQALLMALQAGLPPLDFSPLAGRGCRAYIAGIHAAVGRDYRPLAVMFGRVIARSRRRFQCAMKASVLAGNSVLAPSANGARIPSTTDEVWAERRSAAARAAADFRCGLDCLSVMLAMVRLRRGK